MKHAAVRAMNCTSCHERGMTWKTNTGVRLWVRPSNHHGTQDCDGSGCHSTRDRFGVRQSSAAVLPTLKASGVSSAVATTPGSAALSSGVAFNHRRAIGSNCASCHTQSGGLGKPASHLPSSSNCEACHTTLSWLPVARVDHLQVTGSCVTCHDGSRARGKPSSHIASSGSCETCHTSNAWTPARFDHMSVAAHTCISCHDSVHAMGLPLNHVQTRQECDACHGALAWKPAKLDHSALTGNCASCHNNTIALGFSAGHMGTQRDCVTCHRYADWSALAFTHASAAYPGDHKAALACVACHTTNTDQIPYASAANAGSCAGCHSKDFKPELHPKTADGQNYTASELRNCSGACHVYSDAALGTVSRSVSGPYHRVTDAAFKH
jgi:hypothetical protein